jgi:hypothetical protein|tara:strand:- start:49 stop:282 length:234 start_codon:yes stop_codon:yes gene_type:complete
MKKPQRSLKKWGKEDWGYAGKKKRSRYLPKKTRDALTSSQKAAANATKNAATDRGEQYSKYTKAERKALLRTTKKLS